MEPSSQLIQELRSNFFQKLDDDGKSAKDFHVKDIAKITNTDDWLRRFLIHHDLDLKDALTMLYDTCEWRKNTKVNEINEHTVNMDYLAEGSLFAHNRDIDGKSLFIFKCKMHVKGQKDFEELKKCVIYWFERIERQDKGDQITIFFDMADSGLSNMDMEYTKYLIGLCKSYYPHFLNYILIFEMPWVLNAAFKIIKSWLPTKAVQKIKFVSKSSLRDYVTPDQALKCWGGLDDYEFVFIKEQSPMELMNGRCDDVKKKVHFADGSPIVDIAPTFGDMKSDTFLPVSSSIIRIVPNDAIYFNLDGSELLGSMTLSNIGEVPITYKIKTTSPEKFRVRPSCGLLSSNQKAVISVVVVPGYQGNSILREKFLVMAFQAKSDDYSPNELIEMWKNTDLKDIEQHRLRCLLPEVQNTAVFHNGGPNKLGQETAHKVSDYNMAGNGTDVYSKIGQLVNGIEHLEECNTKLQKEMSMIKRLIILTLIMLIITATFLMTFVSYKSASNHQSVAHPSEISESDINNVLRDYEL